MAPGISGSPERLTTLPQALFFSRKMAPIFLQALSFWVRCRRRLFFSAKKGPIFLGTDPPDLGTDHEGTARKYLARHGIMRARHGNIWHGTDPPDLGTARHGTSLLMAPHTNILQIHYIHNTGWLRHGKDTEGYDTAWHGTC